MRSTPYSADAGGIASRRLSSARASRFTSGGRPTLSSCPRRSLPPGSPSWLLSPSSFLMVLSCCRRMYSLWARPISSWVCFWMSAPTFLTWMSRLRMPMTARRRSSGSRVSRIRLLSSSLSVSRVATWSASCPGPSMFILTRVTASRLMPESRPASSSNRATALLISTFAERLEIFSPSASRTRALRYGSSETQLSTWKRWRPWRMS